VSATTQAQRKFEQPRVRKKTFWGKLSNRFSNNSRLGLKKRRRHQSDGKGEQRMSEKTGEIVHQKNRFTTEIKKRRKTTIGGGDTKGGIRRGFTFLNQNTLPSKGKKKKKKRKKGQPHGVASARGKMTRAARATQPIKYLPGEG